MSRLKPHRFYLLFIVIVLMPIYVTAKPTLRILTWPGYSDPDIVKAFEQRHHVNVEVTLVDSDDIMWNRMTSSKREKFDVFAVNTAELQRYIDAGISIPITPSKIPNTHKQLPRFRDLKAITGITRKGKVYAIPYTYSEMGLIYNRKVFKNAPDSFSSMWDPQYAGRVLIHEGSEHNFSLAALTLGFNNPFNIPGNEFNRVSRHLIELRRNILSLYRSPEQAVNLFIQSDVALLFANYGSQQVKLLKQAGADIGYVIPKEGALAWLDCWSITKYAQNKALAEAWINYTLETEVSNTLTKRQGLANTLQDPPPFIHSIKLFGYKK